MLGADGFGFARTPAGIQKIPQVGKVTIGNAVEGGANAAIDRAVLDATRIGDGTKIDNLAQIGHNVQIGRNGFVVSQVGISGSTTVGDNCTFAGQVGIAGHLHIGDNVTIGPQSGVAKDIPSDVVVGGTPPVDQRTYMRTLALMPRFPELFKRLSKLEKELEELKGGKPDALLCAIQTQGIHSMDQPTSFDIRKILEFLPHRYPFLLVDRVNEIVDGEYIKAHKCVSFNEPFFQGHFPGVPVMPGVLIIEALAQAGGLLVLHGFDPSETAGKLFLFSGLEKVRFRRPVFPGDRLDLECRLIRHKLKLWKMEGRAYVDGVLAAEAEITAAVTDRGDM